MNCHLHQRYQNYKSRAVLGLAVMFSVLSLSLPETDAMAAVKKETRQPITSVAISVESNVKADYEIEAATVKITSLSDLYTIGSYAWDSKGSYWEPGDVPKLTVEIHARSGYYFEKTTGAAKFQIQGAEYVSVQRKNSNETLALKLKLSPASGTLDAAKMAEWVGYPVGKATWDAVPYAGAYELKLFRNGQPVRSVEKVNANAYDFYPDMTTGGRYQFRVRAIPKNSEEEKYITPGDWVYSDELDISDDEAYHYEETNDRKKLTPANLGWVKEQDGWWYRNTDGSYPAGTWQNIDGAWYLFDYDGFMLTGWQLRGGKYYYLGSNGTMAAGWLQDNRNWYYLGGDGAMVTGWADIGGQRYYFDSDGVMHTGWLLDGGTWYYFNDDGTIVTNQYIGGYYLDGNGIWKKS